MLYSDTRSVWVTYTAKGSNSRLNDLTPIFCLKNVFAIHSFWAVKSLLLGSDDHLGFMQITRVAQSCHLGNKAEFVLGRH